MRTYNMAAEPYDEPSLTVGELKQYLEQASGDDLKRVVVLDTHDYGCGHSVTLRKCWRGEKLIQANGTAEEAFPRDICQPTLTLMGYRRHIGPTDKVDAAIEKSYRSKRVVFLFDEESFDALMQVKEAGSYDSLAEVVMKALKLAAKAVQERGRL